MARRLRALEIGILIVMAISFLVSAMALVQAVLPYNPLHVYSLQVEKDEACSEESLEVLVDYYVDESLYDGIRSVQVKSDWVAVDVEGVPAGTKRFASDQTIDRNLLRPGRSQGDSHALRIAPQRLGVWILETTTTVRGDNYGLPAIQVVYSAADEYTTIVDSSSPRCRERRQ